MKIKVIEGYQVVIECRASGGGGFISLRFADGQQAEIRSVDSYVELAALAELLRNEPDLDWDESGRVVQSKPQELGRSS